MRTKLYTECSPSVIHGTSHTQSIAFWHILPNSARFGYATEGARTLYPRAAVHRRGQRPPKGLGTNQTPSTGLRHSSFWRKVPESGARSVVTNMTVEATLRPSTHVNMRRIHPG